VRNESQLGPGSASYAKKPATLIAA